MDDNLVKKIRKQVEINLKNWIRNDEALISKELALFDRFMTRREFLKTTSLVALAGLLNHGCSRDYHRPPSKWNEIDEDFALTHFEETAGVTTPAKIIADADLLPSMRHYTPLRALGSDDAAHIKAEALMESFNPHVMVLDDSEALTLSDLNEPNRTYGTPEYIQLCQDDISSDYYLLLYEKAHNGHHGLQELRKELPGTSSMTFNRLVATNGSFHNKVRTSHAISQKMFLLADINEEDTAYESSAKMPLQLYYQRESSHLLHPGVEPAYDLSWHELDLVDIFRSYESHLFSSYKIVDVGSYHDANQHGFLYGTIRFDKYYNYGFVITFNAATDLKPTVKFFAPQFLSINADLIQTLRTSHTDLNANPSSQLYDLAIFSDQTFKPLASLVNTQATASAEILFSFVSYDTSENAYPFDEFIADQTQNIFKKQFYKRYLINVNCSTDGVAYLFESYLPNALLLSTNDTLSLTFTTALIPSVEIWSTIYDQDPQQLEHGYIRHIQNNGSSYNILMATSYFDGVNMGISQKNIDLQIDTTTNKLSSITSKVSNTYFDSSYYEDATLGNVGYKGIWFDAMNVHLDSAESLASCVVQNNGHFKFYCTQNHQGLLRSYFIIGYTDSEGEEHSYLIGFNEKGIKNNDTSYEYQTYDYLKNQITSDSTSFFPPMPLVIDPEEFYPWHAVVTDAEVLYKFPTEKIIDQATRTLMENDDSQGNLLGYMHTHCDLNNKHWYTHEEQKRVTASDGTGSLMRTDIHQVHLHVNNIYDFPVTLDEDTYVEIKFSKKLIVKNVTDPVNIITYHANPHASIFVQPNQQGKIAFEIDAGVQESQFHGATLFYRIISHSTLTHQEDAPLSYVSSTDGLTSVFQEFNISFRMYGRFSTEHYDTVASGRLSSTAYDALSATINPEYHGDIPAFADAFSKLHNDVRPNNASALVNLAQRYTLVSSPTRGIILSRRSGIILRSSKKSSFNLGSWLQHTVKTVKKKAKKVATAVVSAVKTVTQDVAKGINEVVDDINTGLQELGTVIIDAAQAIAAAAEKVWDAIESFAQQLWDWLKSLFDMDTSWSIGQEIKQILIDQFQPLSHASSKNSFSKNFYTVLEESETFITTEIRNVANLIKENIDETIDTVFSQENDVDAQVDSGKQKQQNSKENSTNLDHIMDQVIRIMSSLSGGDLKCTIDTSEGSLYAISTSTFTSIQTTTLPPVEDLLSTTVQDISTLFLDASMQSVEQTLSRDLKTLSDIVIDDIQSIAEAIAKMPLAILNDTSGCTSTLVEEIEREVLDLLGFLLFANKDQFEDMEDVGTFLMAYLINMVDVFLGDAVKDRNGNVIDVAGLIADATLRTTLNDISSQIVLPAPIQTTSSAYKKAIGLTPGGLPEAVYNTLIVLDCIDFVAGFIDKVTAPISDQSATLKKVRTVITLLRTGIKVANPAIVSITNKSSEENPWLAAKILVGILSVFIGLLEYKQGKWEGKYPLFDIQESGTGWACGAMTIASLLKVFKVLFQALIFSFEENNEPNKTLVGLQISIMLITMVKELTGIVQKIAEYNFKSKGVPLLSSKVLATLIVVNSLAELSTLGMQIAMDSIRLDEAIT